MLGLMENCETIQKLHQVVCGSGCIIFFLKSRPIYVNVDSLYVNVDSLYVNVDSLYVNVDSLYVNVDSLYVNVDSLSHL